MIFLKNPLNITNFLTFTNYVVPNNIVMKFLILLLPFLFGFTPTPNMSPQDKLLGSWTLVKFKYGHDAEFNDVPEFVQYVKNITSSHFSWCSYNPEDGEVIGTGGGTYSIDNKNYIESTEFWYPSGTSIPGTKTTFSYKIKGNMWTISGYIKEIELNPSSGEIAPIDSTYISEVWQRIGGV
jgi:hypothetical protein